MSRCLQALVLLVFLAVIGGIRALKVLPDTLAPYTAANPLDVQYVVALHQDGAATMSLPARSKTMVDRDGQQYVCTLPGPGQTSRDSSTADGATDVALTPAQQELLTAAEASEGNMRAPFELINSLKTMCLYRNDGLWTYEMCFKKHTRQFRQQVDPTSQAEDFSCGKYTGDELQNEAVQEDVLSSSGSYYKYVSHVMTGGEKCLLTGQPRSSEVRFTCMRDITENSLVSVREFPTCNYIFTVSTTFLCKHPLFKPPPEPLKTLSCTLVPGHTEAQQHGHTPANSFMGLKLGGVDAEQERGHGSGQPKTIDQELEHDTSTSQRDHDEL